MMLGFFDYLPLYRWRKNLTIKFFLQHLLASFGTLWLLTEISSFFSQQLEVWLSERWWLFFVLAIISALYSSFPQTTFNYRLNGRDVVIEIKISDAFKIQDAIIIPTNTTFETSLRASVSRSPSIQQRFIEDYYDGQTHRLDLDIKEQLEAEGYSFETITDSRLGNKEKYEIGAVIRLKKKERIFYLLAMSHVNQENRAYGTIEELKIALARLWYYIMEKGDKCDIVIPVMGTGRARLPIKREEVIRNIIDSFIASCSTKSYCDKLTIALYPNDVDRYKIDVEELDSYLRHSCQYAEFDIQNNEVVGIGIE